MQVKVDLWSFRNLECVAVKTRQFGLNFGHPFVWQVLRFCLVPTLAPSSRPFPGCRHGARNQAKQGQFRKETPHLYCTHTTINCFTYRTYRICSEWTSSYCCMPSITLWLMGLPPLIASLIRCYFPPPLIAHLL